MGAMNPVIEQEFARIRDDTTAADPGTPNWVTTENQGAALSWETATTFRIRFVVANTGTANANSPYQIYVSKNSGAYAAVTTTSNNVQSADASTSADALAITTANFQLSAGTGTATDGEYDETGEVDANIPLADYTEFEFGMTIVDADVANGDTLDFRVYYNGAAADVYDYTPRITVSKLVSVDLDSAISSSATVSAALGEFVGLNSAISASATVSSAIGLLCNVDSAISSSATVSAELSVPTSVSLDSVIYASSDPYAVNGIRPPVILDFVNEYYDGQSFTDKLTYSGASLATMTDDSGALKHKPHNYLGKTEDITDAYWNKGRTTVLANQYDDEYGNTIIDRLASDATSGQHSVSKFTIEVTNEKWTGAAIVRYVNWPRVALRFVMHDASYVATYNIQTGELAGTNTTGSAIGTIVPTIAKVGTDLYLIKMTLTGHGTATDGTDDLNTFNVFFADRDSYNGETFTGATTDYFGVGKLRLYAETDDLDMAYNPDTFDDYLPNDTTSILYGPRRSAHLYNGSSYDNEGILLETESRTNLIGKSKTISAWGSNALDKTDDQVTGPNGELSLTKVEINTAASADHYIRRFPSLSTSTKYVFSAYVNPGDQGYILFRLYASASGGNHYTSIVYNVFSNTVSLTDTGISGTIYDSGVEVLSSGVKRIWAVVGNFSSVGSNEFSIRTVSSATPTLTGAGRQNDYAGTIGKYFAIGYVDFEVGDVLQNSHVYADDGASVTRSAETLALKAAQAAPSTTNVSFHWKGKISFDDADSGNKPLFGWWDDTNNFLVAFIDTESAGSDLFEAQLKSSAAYSITNGASITPGLNQDVNYALRIYDPSTTNLEIANDGTAYGENTDSSNAFTIPDFSSDDIDLARMQGTSGTTTNEGPVFLNLFRQTDTDWLDYGIEEASNEGSPNLSELGRTINLDSAISASATVASDLQILVGIDSSISASATMAAEMDRQSGLGAEIGDPDLVVGTDGLYVPATIADFIRERYFTNSTETTFGSMFTYTGASLRVMTDSDGKLKWAPHNFLNVSSPVSTQFNQQDSVSVSGDEITSASGTGIHRLRSNSWGAATATATVNLDYTLAAKFTAGTHDFVTLTLRGEFSHNITAVFDLASGTVSETHEDSGTIVATSITADGGSYICRMTGSVQGVTAVALYIGFAEAASGNTFDTSTGSVVWQASAAGTETFSVDEARLYQSTLGGMVDNPDTGTDYVATSAGALYLSRRKSNRYTGSYYERKGLTLESTAATNEETYSNDLDGQWTVSNTDSLTLTADQGVGPAGQTDLDFIEITDTTNETHFVSNASVSAASGVPRCFSCYVRDVDQRYVAIRWIRAANHWATVTFDLQTGTQTDSQTGATSGSVISSGIKEVGSGLYLIWCSATHGLTTDLFTPRLMFVSSGTPTLDTVGSESYAGTAGVGLYAGYAQQESGRIPTSHIPTFGATATRSAETLTMAGADLAYSATAMSFHLQGELNFIDGGSSFGIAGWRESASVQIDWNANTGAATNAADVRVDHVNTSSQILSAPTDINEGLNQPYNIASRHTTSALNIAKDGSAATASSFSLAMPDLSTDTFYFHDIGAAITPANGTIALFRQDDSNWGDDGIEYITDLNRNVQAVGFFRGYLDSQSGLDSAISCTSSVAAALDTQPGLTSAISAAATVAAELDVVAGVTYQDLDSAISCSATVAAALDTQPGLTSAISATSSVAAALNVQLSLDSNISANGTVSAALSALRSLDSTIVCVSSVSASLNALRGLDSSLVATSLVSADLDAHPGLSSAISATSSVSAALNALHSLDSTISTTSSVAAALSVTWGLDTTISATSSVSAQLSGAVNLDSTITATSTVSAALDAQTALDSAIVATSSVASELNVLRGLDSSVSATSSVAADIGCLVPLDSTIAATSSVAAELNALRSIDSTIAATSSVDAALSVTWGLSSTIAATSSVAAELSGAVNLDSTIAATSSVDAALSVTWGLDTTIAATSSVAAELSTGLNLDSSISAAATVAAALDAQPGLASAITATSSVAAEIGVYCNIDSAISAASSVAADLDVVAGVTYQDLDSAISCSATVAAALDAQPALTSAISATSSVSAELDTQAGLTSAISATSTVAADLDRQQGLNSEIAASSSVSAELIVDVNLTSTVSAQATFTALLDAQQGFASVITGTSLISSELQNLVGLDTSIDAQSFILGLLEGGAPVDPRGDTVLGETLLGDVKLREKLQGAILLDEEGQGAVILEAV